jgi:hypothetical protein
MVKYDEFAFLRQQLAGMLKSGIPPEPALRQMCAAMRRVRSHHRCQTALRAGWAAAIGLWRQVGSFWPAFFLSVSACGCIGGETAAVGANSALRVYTVNKMVADFPTNEDLSTPEAAFATIRRAAVVEGDAAYKRLSASDVVPKLSKAVSKPAAPEIARLLLNAEVLEVTVFDETNAVVFARSPLKDTPQHPSFLLAWMRLEDGRWLNDGSDARHTVEEARALVTRVRAGRQAERALSARPPVANPQAYLRPFTQFLQREAADPRQFLLDALATHRVVVLGEVHHRPRYWAFGASLVSARDFPKQAGVIYLELPSNDQALVDRYLATPNYDPQPVIEMLRDNLWMGWPDQPMLDFFKTVWEIDHSLSPDQPLRIVLVDMARPWKEIKMRQDWQKYDVDRDGFMAANIVRDLREHAGDSRHALFIVGFMHALKNLSHAGGEPIKSAGWHLREAFGDTNVFAVFPHCPVMANMGGVRGRLALGLFETAFATMTNRPMAFPLGHGPFGQLPFDASLDLITTNSYSAGFDAYLYLGPLEDEIFSPLIPGFYTDEFVQELDRRHRIENGSGLVDAYHFANLDAKSFIHWMSTSWGQPRREWSAFQLGPLDAWQQGGSSESMPPKGSVSKAAWAFTGYATPEAAFQSMLWAANKGDRDSFVASIWVPPGSKLSAEEKFADLPSKAQSIAGFAIISKETVSESEVILGVDLYSGDDHHKGRAVMRRLEGKWKFAGDADEQ